MTSEEITATAEAKVAALEARVAEAEKKGISPDQEARFAALFAKIDSLLPEPKPAS